VITLSHTKNDNRNRMITITSEFYLVILVNWMMKCDHIKRLITLSIDYIKQLLQWNDNIWMVLPVSPRVWGWRKCAATRVTLWPGGARGPVGGGRSWSTRCNFRRRFSWHFLVIQDFDSLVSNIDHFECFGSLFWLIPILLIMYITLFLMKWVPI